MRKMNLNLFMLFFVLIMIDIIWVNFLLYLRMFKSWSVERKIRVVNIVLKMLFYIIMWLKLINLFFCVNNLL